MKLSYLPLCLFGLLLFGCPSEDDDSLTPEPVTITGTWNVTDFALNQQGVLILDDTVDYTAQYLYSTRSEGMDVTFSNDGTISSSGQLTLETTITEDGITEHGYLGIDELWWIDNGSTYRVEESTLIIGGRTAGLFTQIEILTLTADKLVFEGTIESRTTGSIGFNTDGQARYTLSR